MTAMKTDPFHARDTFQAPQGKLGIYRLSRLADQGHGQIDSLPFSIRVLLESVLRNCDGFQVEEQHVKHLAGWDAKSPAKVEIPFKPARVVLQDFTGVPCVVDLAAMRAAMARLGGDPQRINPLVPVDLVIDHSVQVDRFGSADALAENMQIEFDRNRERYEFLRWGQKAFNNFRVVPPGLGIVHQVNLEFLAKGVFVRQDAAGAVAVPDTLVGTDSHTTMINGLGVVGWGVGGIEAEAVMLGQPLYLLMPEVVGFELTGELPAGATATDLVLTVTQILRKEGVVDKFVEFFGPGVSKMSVADRATIANMAPEYGATIGYFPTDAVTLDFLRRTGRSDDEVGLVEAYCKEQGLFRTDASPTPRFTKTLSLDLAQVEPSLAGPKRPQDRVPLKRMQEQWRRDLGEAFGKNDPKAVSNPITWEGEGGQPAKQPGKAAAEVGAAKSDPGFAGVEVKSNGDAFKLKHGAVVISAITSCTNTSNPSVMLGAGLLAKKAVEKGLRTKPWVKTSLAPGSRVVTDYLDKAGLSGALDQLGFQTVGYGCTTCIGNSGPLPEPIAAAVKQGDLVVAAVLSGNRNFEGRVNPLTRANYLASPPLVVAYALAGTTDIDFETQPLGEGKGGPVFLRDIWPSAQEVSQAVQQMVRPEMFRQQYGDVFEANEEWNRIKIAGGDLYEWDESSTYIQEPPFLLDLPPVPGPITSIQNARVLAALGDSVTTDHISPAGSIAKDSPAGKYLMEHGVPPADFNSYGARRGNDRVMTRGTLANIRIKNQLVPGVEGGVTRHLPSGQQMSIYEAAMCYQRERVPLVILAGKEYGTGSSRDWAAKGVHLLGVKAVLAQSYERIHRSNLIGMGVLPLVFADGRSWREQGLSGEETFDVPLDDSLRPGARLNVLARSADGVSREIAAIARIDTPVELQYFKNGGILQTVLRMLMAGA